MEIDLGCARNQGTAKPGAHERYVEAGTNGFPPDAAATNETRYGTHVFGDLWAAGNDDKPKRHLHHSEVLVNGS